MILVWKGATVSEPKEVCAPIFAPFLIDTAIEVHALIPTICVHCYIFHGALHIPYLPGFSFDSVEGA